MLIKLRLKNFKCFEDTKELDIRPLTFWWGLIHQGKAAGNLLLPTGLARTGFSMTDPPIWDLFRSRPWVFSKV